MEIRAAVTNGKDENFSIETIELSEPKNNEILVRVVASGVCHTDAVAREQQVPVPLPAVLGHEGAGIVEKVGSAVQNVEPGDHVVMSFASCGYCENCLSGQPAYCMRFNELNFGGKHYDGSSRIKKDNEEISSFFGQSSFGNHAIVHERNIAKIDKDVDLALMGPLGCGLQTGAGTVLNKFKPEVGSSIAVYGCGAVGLSAVMAAKIAGCTKIIAVDLHENRLKLAKELGATHAFNGKEVDVVKEIKEVTNGGTNYALESTGVPQVVRQSLHALRPLGMTGIVGVTGEVPMNIHEDIMAEGKTMVGVIEGNAIPPLFIPKLVEYYKQGIFPIDKLVKFYDLEEIDQAFADSENGSVIKPIIRFPENA